MREADLDEPTLSKPHMIWSGWTHFIQTQPYIQVAQSNSPPTYTLIRETVSLWEGRDAATFIIPCIPLATPSQKETVEPRKRQKRDDPGGEVSLQEEKPKEPAGFWGGGLVTEDDKIAEKKEKILSDKC